MILFLMCTLFLWGESCNTGKKNQQKVNATIPEAEVLSSIDLKDVASMGLVAIDRQLLVLDTKVAVIKKMDPVQGNITQRIDLKIKAPVGLTAIGKTVWTTDNENKTVVQIDTKNGEIIKSFEVPIDGDVEHTNIQDIAASGKFIWIALEAGWSSKILKMNSTDGEVIMEFFADCFPKGLAVHKRNLYILAYNKGVYNGTIKKMSISGDPVKMRKSACFISNTPGKEPSGIAFIGKELWISDNQLNQIHKIKLP
ncbi:MAG: hypothetical protein K9H26_15415 [Prolixibacteraceae bacterium]|nr:hypothetical protein [Prolixibacteraceae bacterium]